MAEELDIFEGRRETFAIHVNEYSVPMDMLLDLIARAEIPIRDVFLSNVTEQYLEYINTQEFLDHEKACYFVTYAARILDLKVRSLLPKTEEEAIQYEEEKETFLYELEMRQIFLEAMGLLRARETTNVFGIEPEYTKNDYQLVIADDEFNMDALVDAFAHIMHRFQANAEKKANTRVVVKDRFTVVDKTKQLIILLKEKREISFEGLFVSEDGEHPYTVGERINTFLALLELFRRQFAHYTQDGEFGAITITLVEGAEDMTYESILGGSDYADYEYDDNNKKGRKDA